MWDQILLLILGLVILVKGADWLVSGASSLAKKFGISTLIIGLTVVAFGTSAPELAINLFAAIVGKSEVTLGNVIGSNIANILLILGAAGIIIPLKVQYTTIWKEIPFGFLAALCLFVMTNDHIIDRTNPMLSRVEGFLLLFFFAIFMYYAFELASQTRVQNGSMEIKKMSNLKIWILIISGLTCLSFGGWLTVEKASAIAKNLGLSDFMISATIVAMGSSFPELVTSVVAAFKKEADLAVGNVVGSNIFNVFLVLAISLIVNPITTIGKINYDIMILLMVSSLLFIFMFIGEKHKLNKWQAYIFIILYIAYIAYLISRQFV